MVSNLPPNIRIGIVKCSVSGTKIELWDKDSFRTYLTNLPPGDAWKKREVKNGVRAVDFIKAVSWCKDPRIQDALADIAKRTDDESIKEALHWDEK